MSESNTQEATQEEIDEAFANEELFAVNGVTEDGFEDDAEFNITAFQADMEEKLNDLVEEYTKKAEEWKAGLMNQYLLNEEVSIYDWSQGESRCIVAKDYTPCCTTDRRQYFEWVMSDPVRVQSTTKYVKCRESPLFKDFIMKKEWEWEYGLFKEGDSFCRFMSPLIDPIVPGEPEEQPGDPIKGKEIECPAENRKVCMWDKNGVGCCTENLDLAHSWHDTGCVGPCSWSTPATLEVVAKRAVPFNPNVIYALTDIPGIRNQFNFECPTHHPVPTVAILLGLFIPITIILCAIVGFIHFVGRCRNQPKSDEEEAAEK